MITIKGLSKGLGNFHLGPLNLEVSDAQILVVLGRNGSGKTTLLNLIAGILQTDEGKIFLDKNLLNGISLEKRKIGYVFQRLYLFPHLDVFSNITFGLQSRKNSEFVIKTKETFLPICLTALSSSSWRRPVIKTYSLLLYIYYLLGRTAVRRHGLYRYFRQ